MTLKTSKIYKNLVEKTELLVGKFDFLFEPYLGVKLLKTSSVLSGYLFLLAFMYITLLFVPTSLTGNFGEIYFGEHSLSILVVLLTVLLSAGLVLLVDDAKGWSLARAAIIRDIIRLRGLMVSCLIIISWSVLPNLYYSDLTLKTLLSPVLVVAFIFILSIYIRLYLWLSDLAADPSFFYENEDREDNSGRMYIGGSYRMARILRLIRTLNAKDVWQSVLERKIPLGYEEVLHEEFFKSIENIIATKNESKYSDLSQRVSIYDKYYDRRNLKSWRFYLEYPKRFLSIYAQLDKDKIEDKPKGFGRLHQARISLLSINKRLIEDSMSSEGFWSLLDALNEYIKIKGLLSYESSVNRVVPPDLIVSFFINTYLDKVISKDLELYNIESYFDEYRHWRVTYDSLVKDKVFPAYQFEKIFKDRLFKELGGLKENEGLYEFDELLSIHFPESDPILLASYYWLLYLGQNTTDNEAVVSLYVSSSKPFGMIGRSQINDWDDNEDARRRVYLDSVRKEENKAAALFSERYAPYFLGFWSVEDMMEIIEKTIQSGNLNELELIRAERLSKMLKLVIKHYKKIGLI